MFPRSRRTAVAKQRCESRLERPGQASMGLQTLSFSFSRTWQTIKDRASVIRSVDSRVPCTRVRYSFFVSFHELLGGVKMFHLLINYYGNLDHCLVFGIIFNENSWILKKIDISIDSTKVFECLFLTGCILIFWNDFNLVISKFVC